MDGQHRAQEGVRQIPGGAGDTAPEAVSANGQISTELDASEIEEALARLTAALRAGLSESGQGPDLLSAQLPDNVDPFEFYGSGETRPQQDSALRHSQDLPWETASGPAGIVERRVALMAQDMAAFGSLGRETPLRLDPPAEVFRHEYFA